ncbi:MAG: urease subunit beta [Paracoccaceae bacterium]
MKPGEIITLEGDLILNQGMESFEMNVSNSGDRPIQVGSHFHFAETNEALKFDRNLSIGYRLNIPSGTAVRFEPGQTKTINLIPFRGNRKIYGFNAKVMGDLNV